MNNKRPPIPAIVIILLLIAVSVYFIVTQTTAKENGALTASGSIAQPETPNMHNVDEG